MRRAPRQILLPAGVFLLLLAAALAAVHHAQGTPKGALFVTLQAYTSAVRAGDAAAARTLAPDLDPGALATHVEALQGLIGHVDRVGIAREGRDGLAHVTWLDPLGRARHEEVLAWRFRAPEGWRLERIQVIQ